MSNNCIYLRRKLNRKLECKKDKRRNVTNDCFNCPYKKYKQNNDNSFKYKSSKLRKLENNRESLFTNDMDHCIICGRSPVNKHEIFGGKNRLNSIKYKLVIPLCTREHHDQVNCRGIHFDKKLQNEWHKKGQAAFEKAYPNLKFIDIFKRNY